MLTSCPALNSKEVGDRGVEMGAHSENREGPLP